MNKILHKRSKNSKANINKTDRLRQSLANEAAKIMVMEGVRDFHRAKNKASERLGNSQQGSLPSNYEIEQAMFLYQETFVSEHDEIINAQRCAALEVMNWLKEFAPYLTGCVLEGAVGVNTVITLHVSSETVEKVLTVIQHKKILTEISQRRIKLSRELEYLPTICFEYQDFEIEVMVFTLRQQYQKPKSKSRNNSMPRADLKSLQLMLAENESINDKRD